MQTNLRHTYPPPPPNKNIYSVLQSLCQGQSCCQKVALPHLDHVSQLENNSMFCLAALLHGALSKASFDKLIMSTPFQGQPPKQYKTWMYHRPSARKAKKHYFPLPLAVELARGRGGSERTFFGDDPRGKRILRSPRSPAFQVCLFRGSDPTGILALYT